MAGTRVKITLVFKGVVSSSAQNINQKKSTREPLTINERKKSDQLHESPYLSQIYGKRMTAPKRKRSMVSTLESTAPAIAPPTVKEVATRTVATNISPCTAMEDPVFSFPGSSMLSVRQNQKDQADFLVCSMVDMAVARIVLMSVRLAGTIMVLFSRASLPN